MKTVKIDTEYIKLNQFLKFAAIIQNGSDGKLIISEGKIKVNGEVENIRRTSQEMQEKPLLFQEKPTRKSGA